MVGTYHHCKEKESAYIYRPTLLILHGTASGALVWHECWEELATRDLTYIALVYQDSVVQLHRYHYEKRNYFQRTKVLLLVSVQLEPFFFVHRHILVLKFFKGVDRSLNFPPNQSSYNSKNSYSELLEG